MDIKNNRPKEIVQLSRELNIAPPGPKHIHLMGICGTGMASLAGILKQKGYYITGSDENIYPPMSDFLEELSIPVTKGYGPDNLAVRPDLVIVGNVITKHNPEAVELSRLQIPYLSFSQAIRLFAIDGKRSIVVSGTHGKTTTSSLVSWILEKVNMDPGFMIGGILNNFQKNFKLGKGPYFVVEGDEYDTAFFDKGPKFLHYSPWITILTSIEFDHADIFRDLDHIISCFRKLIDLIPDDGLLIANADDPIVTTLSKEAKCRVITYGLNRGSIWTAEDVSQEKGMTRLKVLKQGKEYISLLTPLYGSHNISNLLSAVALSEFLDLDIASLSHAVKSFRGVKRRQEIRGEKKGILVIDDFAHHPTAVEKTISSVKERYMNRRLVAVFEPRSNSSRRKVFQERYSLSFNDADLIFIPEPPMMEKVPPRERFSSQMLVNSLKEKGLRAFYCPDSDHLLQDLIKHVREGDVILIMSNGSFDNIHDKILNRLEIF